MIKFSFLGDIAFVGGYMDLAAQKMNPFSNIQDILSSSDQVIGNLECLAQGDEGENELKKPRLKTTIEALSYLKVLNVCLVGLAHNHVYDNLYDGFEKTTRFLRQNEIEYWGAGETPEEAAPYIIKQVGDLRFGLFNYAAGDTNPNLPAQAKVFLNWFDEEKTIARIKEIRRAVDYVILYLHWGGEMEGGYYPAYEQFRTARCLIDAGADLIVGHHSHTLQPYEIYKGKYIFYSLGNFCYDDYIFEGKLRKLDRKRRTKSVILNVFFSKGGYSVEFIPIHNDEKYIKINPAVLRVLKRRNLMFSIMKRNNWLWKSYHIYFLYIFPVFRFIFGKGRPLKDKLQSVSIGKIRKFWSKKRGQARIRH